MGLNPFHRVLGPNLAGNRATIDDDGTQLDQILTGQKADKTSAISDSTRQTHVYLALTPSGWVTPKAFTGKPTLKVFGPVCPTDTKPFVQYQWGPLRRTGSIRPIKR